MDERGRIVIPQHYRDAIGLSPGSMISIYQDGDRLVLVNEGNARERLIAAFADLDHSMADRLTAERQEP